MRMDANAEELSSTRDSTWLLWLGLGLTTFWVALQLFYIIDIVGVRHFVEEGPPSVGGFLEGAFAPLAFLWLVVGFFLQREELQRSSRAIKLQYNEMRRTAENAEIQSRAIAGSEMHARQEAFLRLVDLIQRQLAAVLGLLFMSSQTVSAGGTTPDEETGAMWTQLGNGDVFVFGRGMMIAHFRGDGPQDTWALFWSTPIRIRHTENFMRIFDRMIERARGCDADGLLAETLRGSTHGQVYDLMEATRSGVEPAT
jgi:hypothetical protein